MWFSGAPEDQSDQTLFVGWMLLRLANSLQKMHALYESGDLNVKDSGFIPYFSKI